MQQPKLWWVSILVLLVNLTSTHRVGQKAIFPNEFCQAEENIIKGGLSWKVSKRDRVPVSPWHWLKSREILLPFALVVNIDQTPLKYFLVGNEIMAAKGEHSVTIEGSADKHSITRTLAISFDGNFLPVHFIYSGKTAQSLLRFEFPKTSASAQIPNVFQTWINRLSSWKKSLSLMQPNKDRFWNALGIRKH